MAAAQAMRAPEQDVGELGGFLDGLPDLDLSGLDDWGGEDEAGAPPPVPASVPAPAPVQQQPSRVRPPVAKALAFPPAGCLQPHGQLAAAHSAPAWPQQQHLPAAQPSARPHSLRQAAGAHKASPYTPACKPRSLLSQPIAARPAAQLQQRPSQCSDATAWGQAASQAGWAASSPYAPPHSLHAGLAQPGAQHTPPQQGTPGSQAAPGLRAGPQPRRQLAATPQHQQQWGAAAAPQQQRTPGAWAAHSPMPQPPSLRPQAQAAGPGAAAATPRCHARGAALQPACASPATPAPQRAPAAAAPSVPRLPLAEGQIVFCARSTNPDGSQALSIDWLHTHAFARLPPADRAGAEYARLSRAAAQHGLVPVQLRSQAWGPGGPLLSLASGEAPLSAARSAPTPASAPEVQGAAPQQEDGFAAAAGAAASVRRAAAAEQAQASPSKQASFSGHRSGGSGGQPPQVPRREREAADESVAGAPPRRKAGGGGGGAATPASAKVTIRLTPLGREARAAMLATGNIPSLELICRPKKEVAQVLARLGKRWAAASPGPAWPAGPWALRLHPTAAHPVIAGASWGPPSLPDSLTVADLAAVMGWPDVLPLHYAWHRLAEHAGVAAEPPAEAPAKKARRDAAAAANPFQDELEALEDFFGEAGSAEAGRAVLALDALLSDSSGAQHAAEPAAGAAAAGRPAPPGGGAQCAQPAPADATPCSQPRGAQAGGSGAVWSKNAAKSGGGRRPAARPAEQSLGARAPGAERGTKATGTQQGTRKRRRASEEPAAEGSAPAGDESGPAAPAPQAEAAPAEAPSAQPLASSSAANAAGQRSGAAAAAPKPAARRGRRRGENVPGATAKRKQPKARAGAARPASAARSLSPSLRLQPGPPAATEERTCDGFDAWAAFSRERQAGERPAAAPAAADQEQAAGEGAGAGDLSLSGWDAPPPAAAAGAAAQQCAEAQALQGLDLDGPLDFDDVLSSLLF